MSLSPRRRPGVQCVAGGHARQIPTDLHEGDHWDYLSRHELEASVTAHGSRQQRREFGRHLLLRATDTRNILCAIENLTSEGAKAPGPNGVQLERLDKAERCQLARELGRAMREGIYRPGTVRRLQIPKTSGVGHRTLEIPNAEDKVAQRAIAQAIQPLLDPNLNELSFGFRPHRGRENALAMAELLTNRHNSWTWITQDLANAFTQVPHNRLGDVLRLRDIPADLTGLILRSVWNARRRGIPQGGPLSPILLNVYLDHSLDSPWRNQHPDLPLVRVADDLLVLGRNDQEAQNAHSALEQLTRNAAMPLKHPRHTAIRQLDQGQHADWLGYRLTMENRRLRTRLEPGSLLGLADSLESCHDEPHPTLRAADTVLGWLDQAGPTYPYEDQEDVIARIRETANTYAFDELPPDGELHETWRRAYARYRCIRHAYALSDRSSNHGDAGGSARQHRDSADSGRGCGAPHRGAPRPSFSDGFDLYTDGSCLGSHGIGGWAFVLEGPAPGQRLCQSGSALRATNNRMELTAIIEGLRAVPRPARVRVTTDSRYAYDGLVSRLASWRQHGWRRADGGRLANASLWRDLAELLEAHNVTLEWVRGHSGQGQNELCDSMATAAAHERQGLST